MDFYNPGLGVPAAAQNYHTTSYDLGNSRLVDRLDQALEFQGKMLLTPHSHMPTDTNTRHNRIDG